MPKKPPSQLYHPDLAAIHIDGYGFHWEGAADSILKWLRQYEIHDGMVVDIGCGGGQWMERLESEGYTTCGVDVSASMLKAAKKRAKKAKFLHGACADVTLPTCAAVTSLGEPLNYETNATLFRRSLRNVYKALQPGGVFIFDVRHPATTPVAPFNHVHQSDDWFCHARIEEDHNKGTLTRYITTFLRTTGGKSFRRQEEVHRLKLFPRKQVAGWLRDLGLKVTTKRGYGDYQLKVRQSVFICRK